MIICNHCGKQVQAGLARCQYCGMPLSGVANRGMNAQEQEELPAWLESLRANERPPVSSGGQPGFSTADLIDDGDIPGWMRTEQTRDAGEGDSSKHRAIRPAGMSAPNTDVGMMRGGSFSAHDLIDPVSLPPWMNPGQQPANLAPPAFPGGAGAPRQFSANDLVDHQSLPSWITSGQPVPPMPQPASATWQGTPSPVSPPPGNPAPPAMNAGNGPQSGLSASSLLDVNALPPWLREGQQGQAGSRNMSAGSLIDVNALPSWLRAVDGQQQGLQGQQAGRVAPPLSSTAPRIETPRVPVRPRAEMMSPEQSEAAASVFSSVLGVASVSPQYPALPAGDQQSFANAPAGSFPGMQPASPLAAPAGFNNLQAMPQPAQGSIPGSYPGTYAGAFPTSGPQMQNPYIANQGQPLPQQPSASVMQTGAFQSGQLGPANAAGANARPGKRSFLDTIREWFHF